MKYVLTYSLQDNDQDKGLFEVISRNVQGSRMAPAVNRGCVWKTHRNPLVAATSSIKSPTHLIFYILYLNLLLVQRC